MKLLLAQHPSSAINLLRHLCLILCNNGDWTSILFFSVTNQQKEHANALITLQIHFCYKVPPVKFLFKTACTSFMSLQSSHLLGNRNNTSITHNDHNNTMTVILHAICLADILFWHSHSKLFLHNPTHSKSTVPWSALWLQNKSTKLLHKNRSSPYHSHAPSGCRVCVKICAHNVHIRWNCSDCTMTQIQSSL